MPALNVNEVILGGRLTKEPILEYTLKDIPVTNILLAINIKDNVDFIEVIAYGDTAIDVCNHCTINTEVFVKGTLKYFKDIGKLKVKVKKIQFVSRTKDSKESWKE